MKRAIKYIAFTLLAAIIWIAANILSLKQGWFLTPMETSKSPAAFMSKVEDNIGQHQVGNLSLVLMNGGQVFAQKHWDINGHIIDDNTIWHAASIAKWVTSFGVMQLVEQGKLDLDTPVSKYLTRWQLPESKFDNNKVTVRRLLSHTAGLTDGLGHNGFSTKEEVQPLVEHLTLANDKESDVSGKVEVNYAPGSRFKYSGGGYNLLQLLVEEVSNMSFGEYMQTNVLSPLAMNNTSYRMPTDNENIARFYDTEENAQPLRWYTSLAATGLYTSTSDIVKFIQHQLDILNDNDNVSYVSKQLLTSMLRPHASMYGIDIWGAGVMLFAPNNEGGFIVGHEGKNQSLNTTARFNPETGNGIIMFVSGTQTTLASNIATHWTLWETGKPDLYMFRNLIPNTLKRTAWGIVLLIIVFTVMGWHRKRNYQNNPG